MAVLLSFVLRQIMEALQPFCAVQHLVICDISITTSTTTARLAAIIKPCPPKHLLWLVSSYLQVETCHHSYLDCSYRLPLLSALCHIFYVRDNKPLQIF